MTIPGPISPKLRDHAVARKFVSQNSRGYMAIAIYDAAGVAVDPTVDTLRITVYFDDLLTTHIDPRGVVVATGDTASGIVADDTGMFHFDIGPEWTRQTGLLHAEWTYTVDTHDFTFQDDMQILEQMPYYESLRPEAKRIVEQVSWFFGDMFDSTAGGPWLQENFQTHFTYERIAQLTAQATMKFNMLGYPITNFGIEVDQTKLPSNMTQVVVWGTKLECIRHLALSYTEQPDFRNMQVTYTDRRDYSERWMRMLAEETQSYEKAIKMAKRSLLNLGRGSLLVAGGIYGGGMKGGFFVPGLYSAQVRSFRFYPASFAVNLGNIIGGDGQ